jgi:ADP-ribose pyrophosphatase YjhB (NUDIX family)
MTEHVPAGAGPGRVVRLGAYAVCVDGVGRLLLCRIAAGYPAVGLWTLPGGGVEFGEHPDTAVLRELGEETGLTGTIDGIVGVWSRHYRGDETASGKELHFLGVVYRVTPAATEPLVVEVGGSTDAVGWFDLDTAAGLDLGDLARYALANLGADA